jgi:hypothetical protein
MHGRTERTPEKEAAFLETLAESANVTKSCEINGIARRSAYEWREKDPDFAKRWDEAINLGVDALEDEAVRRGRDGVDEPVFYQGQVCGMIRRYSDTMLIVSLKARRPEKYSERFQHTGAEGGPITTEVVYRWAEPGKEEAK